MVQKSSKSLSKGNIGEVDRNLHLESVFAFQFDTRRPRNFSQDIGERCIMGRHAQKPLAFLPMNLGRRLCQSTGGQKESKEKRGKDKESLRLPRQVAAALQKCVRKGQGVRHETAAQKFRPRRTLTAAGIHVK